jgi:hypothetical protein
VSVVREERVTFQAECDGCGARGPERETEASAVEGVTADATTKRVGISLLGRWRHRGGGRLYCPMCFAKNAHPNG